MDLQKPINKKGKIGLYFGSFNPITKAHLEVALESVNHVLDEVWIIVSPFNPDKHKTGELANKEHRWNMVQKALKDVGEDRIKASNIEYFLPRPSYTDKCLKEIKNDNPEAEIFIVCGTDTHHRIQTWKEGDWIHGNFKFLIFPREQGDHVPVENKVLHNNSIYLESERIHCNLSSTIVRESIRSNKPIRDFVSPSVFRYIEKNELYKK